MASRPLAKPYSVITNASMATTITSTPTIIDQLSMISYEVNWSGTSPAGTISVQASNSYSQNIAGGVSNAGSWNTLTLSIIPTISGNTGSGFIDIDKLAGYAIRLVYTPTAGTGVMNVIVAAKVA
jgi:hypothetical protein